MWARESQMLTDTPIYNWQLVNIKKLKANEAERRRRREGKIAMNWELENCKCFQREDEKATWLNRSFTLVGTLAVHIG